MESLRNTGTLEPLFALLDDPERGAAVRENFRSQVSDARAQTAERETLNVGSWIKEFVHGYDKKTDETDQKKTEIQVDTARSSEVKEKRGEWLKDIRAFDVLLEKHPEILGKLKAQGIDLDAEKSREREKIRKANPDMGDGEIEARSTIAVYLRHQQAISAAAPDNGTRKEFDAGFERLRSHARDAGISYQETIRNAAGILPADKAAIMALSGVTLDTRITRVGNALYVDSPGDSLRQVWILRPGERPEKSIEIPDGPRIRIAAAPDLPLL